MKILNVDDNAQNRYLIEAVGQANGFEVFSARNGVEALETLDGHRNQLACLLDSASPPLSAAALHR